MTSLRITVEKVGPEVAQSWLDAQGLNRNFKTRMVDAIARDIREGNWRTTGDTIKFDSEGRLLDGQNRLMAIVRSGMTVELAIARNVIADDVLIAVDHGTPRTVADALRMRGYSDPNNLAALVGLVISYRAGKPWSIERKLNVSEALDALETDEPWLDSLKLGGRVRKHVGGQRSTMSAVAHLAGEYDRDLRDDFYEALITGIGLEEGSPVLALRSRLISDAQKRGHASPRMSRKYVAAITIKAILAFDAGAETRTMRWRSSGPQAEAFPLFPPSVGGAA